MGGDIQFPRNTWSMVAMSSVTSRKNLRVDLLPDARAKILVSTPHESTSNTPQIQPFTSFLASKVQEKKSKQSSLRKDGAEPHAGNDGRHFHGGKKFGQNNGFQSISHMIQSSNQDYENCGLI